VIRNLDAALGQNADRETMVADQPMEAEWIAPTGDLSDFKQMVRPIALKNYLGLIGKEYVNRGTPS
jgi:hypothetical protein